MRVWKLWMSFIVRGLVEGILESRARRLRGLRLRLNRQLEFQGHRLAATSSAGWATSCLSLRSGVPQCQLIMTVRRLQAGLALTVGHRGAPAVVT